MFVPFTLKAIPSRHKEDGFTLLEVLVVLVLVSLVVGFLMQGFGHVLKLRVYFVGHAEQQQTRILKEQWFRSLVGSVTPAYSEGVDQFQGEKTKITGLTMAALDSRPGVPAPLKLQLENEDGTVELRYRTSGGAEWVLGQWQDAEGSFEYLDKKGDWHTRWPPGLGVHEQLPVAIQLKVNRALRPTQWLVNIPGRKEPRIDVIKELRI